MFAESGIPMHVYLEKYELYQAILGLPLLCRLESILATYHYERSQRYIADNDDCDRAIRVVTGPDILRRGNVL